MTRWHATHATIGVLMLIVCVAACHAPVTDRTCDQQVLERKDWTILIHMVTDQSLESFALRDLREMEQVGSNPDVNIAVQLETPGRVQRYVIRPGSHDVCRSDVGLESFVPWGRKTRPADHQALVLWGHSRGIADRLELPAADFKVAGRDAHLWLPGVMEVSRALAATVASSAKFDVIGFDSCFWGSIEAAHELRGMARFMVASEGPIDKRGWDYAAALAPMKARAPAEARPDARAFAQHIARHLGTPGSSAGLSMFDLEHSEATVGAAANFVTALRAAAIRDPDQRRLLSILLRHTKAVRVRQFLDLTDFCRLANDGFDPPVRQRALAMEAALHQFAIEGSVSIYYPHVLAPDRSAEEPASAAILDGFVAPTAYGQFAFVHDSGWNQLFDLLQP